jgi:ADP-ribose pyrophosphatase
MQLNQPKEIALMPGKKKPVTKAKPAKPIKPIKAKNAKSEKPGKKLKPAKAPEKHAKISRPDNSKKEQLVNSTVMYTGPLFRVLHDELIDPAGHHGTRDVIRHNGSVVILAVDTTKSKRDPLIVIERQYRHAAGQYLWELPAGKLDPGEEALTGAQRELAEETGYHARKWKLLIEYYASPGFLGESMKIFVAENLVAGVAHPEEDEQIEIRHIRLSEILKAIDKGYIIDGKTLTGVQIYARKLARKG